MENSFSPDKKIKHVKEDHQKNRIIASGNLRRPSWENVNPNSSHGFQEEQEDSRNE